MDILGKWGTYINYYLGILLHRFFIIEAYKARSDEQEIS